MKAAESWSRYVLLPEEGAISISAPAAELLERLPRARSTAPPEAGSLDFAEGREVNVVDATDAGGARLIEADAEIAAIVNRSAAPLRMLPLIEFAPPNPQLRAQAEPDGSGAAAVAEVTCTDESSGTAVVGARVIAFTDFFNEIGAEGVTDANGTVNLNLASTAIERLYVYSPDTAPRYWGSFRHSLSVATPISIAMAPIDLGYIDSVRHYYGNSRFDAQRGIRVGVIDTGVGPHRDLNVTGGTNTVTGEPAGEYTDPRGHGTHVAGLAGSNGTPPTGLRGLAPDVELRAYRVFPGGGGGASSYAILKALARAAADQCDIVNLSLGGGPHDPAVEEAVVDARATGMLVVVAAGNDYRMPASFPSVYPQATCVTAMGRLGTFPVGSLEDSKVAQSPTGNDPDEFLASFTNVGQEVTATAPGVGALSTMPDNEFSPMNGTSMAAPVLSGAVACLLSRDPAIFGMSRDAARAKAIEGLLAGSCLPLGFGAIYEGSGMPDPALV